MDGCAARVAARESATNESNLSMLPSMNRLYFGDNLKWLSDRKEFPDASVDLVYLDPPFNSNADHNVLFREPSGQVSQA
jgi:16S rRNA G966 N2-methylase RsmD